ncbi:hypothetical protein E5288_WYG015354 [Bos mutus]|uniref:Uncharacterized protein n=1 Tax=Bos mutus TaxID=72004 RepID=A0A6B0RIR7_9CETA|nr:hypothetical protein [Bos mutus]
MGEDFGWSCSGLQRSHCFTLDFYHLSEGQSKGLRPAVVQPTATRRQGNVSSCVFARWKMLPRSKLACCARRPVWQTEWMESSSQLPVLASLDMISHIKPIILPLFIRFTLCKLPKSCGQYRRDVPKRVSQTF